MEGKRQCTAETFGSLESLAVSILSNSAIAGYLASAGYFLLNLLGDVSDGSIFYLFSMEKGNYMTKMYLLGWGLVMSIFSLIYVSKYNSIKNSKEKIKHHYMFVADTSRD